MKGKFECRPIEYYEVVTVYTVNGFECTKIDRFCRLKYERKNYPTFLKSPGLKKELILKRIGYAPEHRMN